MANTVHLLLLIIVKGDQPCNQCCNGAAIKQTRERLEEALSPMQRSTLLLPSVPLLLPTKTPIMAKSRNNAVDGLDNWERIELKRVFEAYGSSSSGGGEDWLA